MLRTLLSVATVAAIASQSYGSLIITEAMSSSGTGGTVDWFELTNTGITAVNITGYKMDDGGNTFGSAVALNNITSIAAGESVVFIEAAADTDIDAFRTFWGGTANSIQIGRYNGSGVGLSSGGDGVVVFDDTGTTAAPLVSFGAATAGVSFDFSPSLLSPPPTERRWGQRCLHVSKRRGQCRLAGRHPRTRRPRPARFGRTGDGSATSGLIFPIFPTHPAGPIRPRVGPAFFWGNLQRTCPIPVQRRIAAPTRPRRSTHQIAAPLSRTKGLRAILAVGMYLAHTFLT